MSRLRNDGIILERLILSISRNLLRRDRSALNGSIWAKFRLKSRKNIKVESIESKFNQRALRCWHDRINLTFLIGNVRNVRTLFEHVRTCSRLPTAGWTSNPSSRTKPEPELNLNRTLVFGSGSNRVREVLNRTLATLPATDKHKIIISK